MESARLHAVLDEIYPDDIEHRVMVKGHEFGYTIQCLDKDKDLHELKLTDQDMCALYKASFAEVEAYLRDGSWAKVDYK